MAVDGFYSDWTFIADGDLSAAQFTAVKLSGDQKVAAATANTHVAIGILQDKPTDGKACLVRLHGISKAVAGGTVNAGDLLSATTGGKVQAETGTGKCVVGRALTGGSSGDLITVLVQPSNF